MQPLIAIIDAQTEGHEGLRDEAGPSWDVTILEGFAEAELAVARSAVPVVVAPEALEPEAGRAILARLAASRLRFVGVLLVDDPGVLGSDPLPGVSHVIFRPMRPGVFRVALSAAATARAALLEALSTVAPLESAALTVGEQLRALASEAAPSPSALQHLARWHVLATRPLALTRVALGPLVIDALTQLSPACALALSPPGLRFAEPPQHREPCVEGDALALHAAVHALATTLVEGASSGASLAATLEPFREGDRPGWQLTLEGAPTSPPVTLAPDLAATVIARHGGTLAQAPGRALVWLPSHA
jgi:hypothetical protein